MGTRFRILSVCSLLLVPGTLLGQSTEERELLELASASNRAAVESIRTLHSRYSYIESSRSQAREAEWWRSLDAIRYREQIRSLDRSETSVDAVLQKDRLYAVEKQTSPGYKPQVWGRISAPSAFVDTLYWSALLKIYSVPRDGPVLFHELLSTRPDLLGVRRVQESARDLVHVDLVHPGVGGERCRDELWFDPQVNYLVRKQVRHAGDTRAEHEVVRFKEAAPGIYFPEEVQSRVFRNGKQDTTFVNRFSEIRVNQPLPADTFEWRFPTAIRVYDYVENKAFQVETDGRWRQLKDWRLVPGLMPHSRAVKVAEATVTREEPQSATRWILPLGLLMLGLGCLGLVWRWWKARSALNT
jgi:hypothetical protein